MIKKIDSIRDFGIYKKFSWTSSKGIKDFNCKNLFYGWNYSGKTTLSRIFSSLRDKNIHNSYTSGAFKVSTDNGVYDSSNLESFPYNILVFNSDYIQDNLNFSIHGNNSSASKTILFEVGDNAKYETKIIELQGEIDSINGTDVILGKKIRFQSDIDEFEIYDKGYTGKFTLISKEIQDEHFLSLIRFTKTNLKPIILKIKDDLSGFLVNDKKELSHLNDIVKVSEPKDELNKVVIDFNYNLIVEEVNKVLSNIPERKVLNKILDTNNDVYNWVKKGKDLHTPNSTCLFCDNIVSEERLNYLIEYFNSQASVLKEGVDKLKTLVYEEINKIESINFPSSNNDLNLGFANEYIEIKNKLDKNLAKYKKHLGTIISKLDLKINKNLYTKVDPVISFNVSLNISLIERLNILIQNNNEFSVNFSSKINIERNKLIDHLVASFLKREKYLTKEKKYEKALSEIEKLDKQIEDLEKEIRSYQALKESDKEGAEQYTYFIQSFLNRDDIEIKLDDVTKKFILLRDNQNASNLSEGEKTAIAFSHFLVSIKALESKNKFKDFILFIDDPISSLDGNHIFQVNSLLKDMLFSNKNPGGQWEIRCKQLFFSSHNFEFFNLLKELPLNKKESRYFVERNRANNISEIKILPEIFDKYSSEYHYLFKEINDFNRLRKPLNSDKLLVIPNILRRFLEMYTLTKFPSSDNVDRRADRIFTPEISKRICKPFHFFSHLDNIDRIGKQSEYMADIPIACKELINYIKKKDKLHYEALTIAVAN
jgi:wobble nucleotide-excising tRNase